MITCSLKKRILDQDLWHLAEWLIFGQPNWNFFKLGCVVSIMVVHTGLSGFELKDFGLNLSANLQPANHRWVSSGWTTVAPQADTVAGVGECISPPVAGMGFSLDMTFNVNGRFIHDEGSTGKGDVGLLYKGGVWQPDRIIRRGTYHHLKEAAIISFSVESHLIPLYGESGFLLKLIVGNRSEQTLEVECLPQVSPGCPNVIALDKWTFNRPVPGRPAKSVAHHVWSNEYRDDNYVKIELLEEGGVLQLEPGESKTYVATVLFHKGGNEPTRNLTRSERERMAQKQWRERIQRYTRKLPVLESDIPSLEAYYLHSLASGLVCIWDNPAYAVEPFVTTCGMDGGALCTYLWDLGYVADIALLMFEKNLEGTLELLSEITHEHYAITLDGSGIGPRYAYNAWSFVNLTWAYFNQVGPDAQLFKAAKHVVMLDENLLPKWNGLLDYGYQHNLLEMRSTGWERYVASPNAERAWCFERLADMAETLAKGDQAEGWRRRAEMIRAAIREHLWDAEAGWFRSRYPNGHEETVYSIQAYDALRAGVATSEMKASLLSRIREGAFLGEYGVTSVSKEDSVHYEVLDMDWSGGGAYVAEGPALAQTLYEIGEAELSWDVLKRHFWMGNHLPFYPQEHYHQRPQTPAHKRANEISGLAGAQAILFGLWGFEPQPDGSLWIDPQPPSAGRIVLRDFYIGENVAKLELSSLNLRVELDGQVVYEGKPKRIRLP